MLRLEGLTVTPLTDLPRFDIALGTLLPGADPAALAGLGWLGPDALSGGMVHLVIRSWLIRMPGVNILVDACVGAGKDRPLRPEWHRRDGTAFLAALAAEGLDPDDIDIVFCTHLHADHVGWNTRLEGGRWVPTFRRARHLVGRREYLHWQAAARADPAAGHGSFADSVLPVMAAGLMELVGPGFSPAPGLRLDAAPGHSPGHMVLHVDHGAGAVLCGDVLHSPVQLARPDWSSAFCSDPARARRTRRALLAAVAARGSHLVPAHFPDPGWCRIRADGAGFRPV